MNRISTAKKDLVSYWWQVLIKEMLVCGSMQQCRQSSTSLQVTSSRCIGISIGIGRCALCAVSVVYFKCSYPADNFIIHIFSLPTIPSLPLHTLLLSYPHLTSSHFPSQPFPSLLLISQPSPFPHMTFIFLTSPSLPPSFPFHSSYELYYPLYYQVCIPTGLSMPFLKNNFSMMVLTGAKGSAVNQSQISCFLGQQALEGEKGKKMFVVVVCTVV